MSDKASFVAEVWERAGVCVQDIDVGEYPTMSGFEGPFRMGRDMSFRVLYYDRKSDMYVEVG